MEATAVAVILVTAAIAALVTAAVRTVPPERAGVVERLGRYSRTLQPGLNVIVPVLDRVRATVDLRGQIVSVPSLVYIAADDTRLTIEVNLYYRVTDAVRIVYGVADEAEALRQLAVSILRTVVGAKDGPAARTGREELNQQLREQIPRYAREWGIELTIAEITSLRPTA